MPTLRDDIIEARDRVIEARKPLVNKLINNSSWTRDQEIIALDGMDSLVSMANEVLPFIPNNVVRGDQNVTDIHSNPPAISPAPERQLYKTQFHRQGDWIKNGVPTSVNDLMEPVFPGLPQGYEYQRPNIIVDGGKWQFNMNGRDFTGDNAGTTKREFDLDIVVHVRPGQTGEFKIWPHNNGGDNRVVAWPKDHAQVNKLNGTREAQSFINSFRLKLTDTPRGGEHDWFKIMIEPSIKSASKNDGFYMEGIYVDFILPFTEKNQYRDCHVHTIAKGKLASQTLPSIDRVEENGQFLHFRNDQNEDVLLQKVSDTVGFWFQKGSSAKHDYEITFESDADSGKLTVEADDFHLTGDRFYVMRGGIVEGWVAAEFVKSVKINK